MSEATRLKMTGGHFIWIWADTSSTAEFFQPFESPVDDKDQKGNFDDFSSNRRQKGNSNSRQYYQQPPQQSSSRGRNSNQNRYKSINSNRFHHIIGLRKPNDDALISDNTKSQDVINDQPNGSDLIQLRDKRKDQKKPSNKTKSVQDTARNKSNPSVEDIVNSIENERTANNLNIKNINSHEFNAFYYDPYEQNQQNSQHQRPNRMDIDDENFPENIFGGSDFDEPTDDEDVFYDYDKSNPFQPNPTVTTVKTTLTSTSTISTSTKKVTFPKSTSKNPTITTTTTQSVPTKLVDTGDSLDLENYSDSTNDSKAKRADTFQSPFNISSHVFFHHFKDFPVGLLALRHIKMNVDRVFVRSAIRLFASTWARVERNEEMRYGSSGRSPYDDYSEYASKNSNSNKVKSKAHVNNRNNPIRRKFKRETPQVDGTAQPNESILTLVNSSLNNNSSNLNSNQTQHVSGLNTQQLHSSDVEMKSNIDDNFSHSSNSKNVNKSKSIEDVSSNDTNGAKGNVRKRQDTWWSPNILRGGSIASSISRKYENQERTKSVGTPQYRGGCFGTPTRGDLKRSELFARYEHFLNILKH